MKKRPPRNAMSWRRRRKDREGATAVEFAIVANVMFVMVMTCMEFARLNMVRNLAQDAAYFAARKIIVFGADESEAITEADRIMSTMVSNGYTIDVDPVSFEQPFARVQIRVNLGDIALFAPLFLPTTDFLATAQLGTERYQGFFRQ